MALRNSNIIVATGIKTDRDYINVINTTESYMLSVMRSSQYFVAESSTYSFIRDTGSIQVNFTYAQCLQSNYVAFQNPDYSNKWIFGWIDQVLYVDDGNTQIYYTVDYWTTWWTYFYFQPVLVEREHVNDDSFGLHLLPEPVNADIVQPMYTRSITFDTYNIILHSMHSNVTPSNINNRYVDFADSTVYLPAEATNALAGIESDVNAGNLIAVTLFPADYTGITTTSRLAQPVSNNFVVSAPSSLNGYIPVNNKLFTYPYSYISVDDCSKQILLRYENFPDSGRTNGYTFTVRGYANPVNEMSIYPNWYDGLEINPFYSLSIKDFPMLPVKVDAYSAWLAQKSNSALLSGFTHALSAGVSGGMSGGGAGAAAGAGMGILGGISNYMMGEQAAKDAPDSIRGGDSSSITNIIYGHKGFYIKQVALKSDKAQSIDNFFSKYGYSQNIVKTPNITGRTYWNYVKVNGTAGYGNMPEDARNRINKMLNDGITIWHNHTYLGNYLIGGSKMENPIV